MSTEAIDPRYANYQRPAQMQQRLDGLRQIEGRADAYPSYSDGGSLRIAIIVGRWHQYIVDRLLQGALDTANACGIDDAQIDIVQAPGAYEMPLVAKALARRGNYCALVTLGVMIKGPFIWDVVIK